ncbi:hypothetical protein G7Y89_g4687 [Cudoniella acicularis]|uniref:Heterokaryon incompatibility domain-containing protein n=1 Tax=Cudoniella acicularis TaxID=354080 RepID=A0A8H4W6F7_9HELO|nr:hypothetical protein G7Y89_g4687 [Cudoniella acicularis]
MLCILCQNIQFKRYLELTREEKIDLSTYHEEWPPREDYDEEDILNDDQGIISLPHESFYFHHRNLESLRKAADDGCHFCYQIFYGLLEITVLGRNIENSSERLDLRLQQPSRIHPHFEHLYHGDLAVELGANSLGNMRLRDLNQFIKFAPSSQNMEHNSSTGVSTNLDLAASWLYDCANHHENCCRQPEMESSEGPRLYNTTDDNIEQRQESVDASTLPKTFTDAIAVCRHLGIRFLWIDSLCIIQGNRNDWEMQSEQMGRVYSNAALAISAAIGEDSHAGLFVDRDPQKTYPCTLNFQYPKGDGVITTTPFLVCRDSYFPKAAYLDTRGWTFQEKYLSPRTLRFSETEMYWVCASTHASEGLPIGLCPLTHKSDYDKYIKKDSNGVLPIQVDMVQRYHWWYQAIEIYSHRIFTFESDRLLALSGLASTFQRLDDEFLFGIWKSDMAHGLAWRLSGQCKQPVTDTSPKSPIPSRSWASRPGNIITYSDIESYPGSVMELNEPITSYQIPKGSRQHNFTELLSVESMSPAIVSSASFKSGSLRLRGLVLQVSLEESSVAWDSSTWSTHVPTVFRSRFSDQIFQRSLGYAFYGEPVTKGDELYCLPLGGLSSGRHDMSTRISDTKAQARQRQPFLDNSIDELASMVDMSLKLGVGILPTMTWIYLSSVALSSRALTPSEKDLGELEQALREAVIGS